MIRRGQFFHPLVQKQEDSDDDSILDPDFALPNCEPSDMGTTRAIDICQGILFSLNL